MGEGAPEDRDAHEPRSLSTGGEFRRLLLIPWFSRKSDDLYSVMRKDRV